MRKLFIATLLVISCEGNTPEPAALNYFFQIKSLEGGKEVDFFSVNLNYNYSDLAIKNDNGIHFDAESGKLPEGSGPMYIDIVQYFNETKSFATERIFNTLYLDYGNGDIDTLTQTTKPTNGSFLVNNPDSIFFFLNGKMVVKYDFKANQKLLYESNNPYFLRNQAEFKPVIFSLLKE